MRITDLQGVMLGLDCIYENLGGTFNPPHTSLLCRLSLPFVAREDLDRFALRQYRFNAACLWQRPKTIASSSPKKMSLLVLPIEVIDLLSRYLVKDDLLNLMSTGNRALATRLRQVSNVTLHWKNSRFCDWNRCLPFLRGFSKLRELSMSTEMPVHRTKTMLDFERLPSNLTSLSLNFYHALELVWTENTFKGFVSLTHLSVSQPGLLETIPERNVHLASLFASLPSLEHLFLASEGPTVAYYYDIEDLQSLPSSFLSLDINLTPHARNHSFGAFFPTDVVVALPPTKLQHLGLKIPGILLDIAPWASDLRHLQIYTGLFTFKGAAIERFTSRSGTPIRYMMPKLRTLLLPHNYQLTWDVLETLPLTLTHLGGYVLSPSDKEPLARLNREHRDKVPLNERPGAPRMLKKLELLPPFRDIGSARLILPYFESLASFVSLILPEGSFDVLPSELQDVYVETLSGPLALIPNSVTSITCHNLNIDDENTVKQPNGSTTSYLGREAPSQLRHLVSLNVRGSTFTTDMISLLPRSLEQFQVSLGGIEPVQALCTRANVERLLPKLKSLCLEFLFLHGWDSRSEFEVTADILPTSLVSLELRGPYRLDGSSVSNQSLSRHPNLTSLTLITAKPPQEQLPHLPPGLLRLKMMLSSPFDLNKPQDVALMQLFPPNLTELHMEVHMARDSASFSWFDHLHRSSLKSFLFGRGWNSPFGMRTEFFRALPPFMVTEALIYLLSEKFALSCLPPTLVHLNAPFVSYDQIVGPNPSYLGSRMALAALESWESILMRFCATRLPLIGLFFRTQYAYETSFIKSHRDRYIHLRSMSFPKRISCLYVFGGISEVSTELHKNLAGHKMTDPIVRELYQFRQMFNTSNLIAWTILLFVAPIDRHAHPLGWLFQWINLSGSAIALFTQARAHRAPVLPWAVGKLRKWMVGNTNVPLWLALHGLTAAALALANSATAIALGYSPRQWTPAARVLGVVGIIGQVFLDWLSTVLYRVH